MSETWKDTPRGAQILWVVSADKTQRAGLYYQTCPEPEDLNLWLRRVLILDGHIENPTAEEVRGAVLQHLHAAIHGMWRWQADDAADPDATFYRDRQGFQAAVSALAADAICPADAVAATLKTIRLNPPARRNALRDELAAWFKAWSRRTRNGRDAAPWMQTLHRWYKKASLPGLDDAATLEVLLKVLRSQDAPAKHEPEDKK